ncbi:hypothetical protein L1887_31545 [Cichorium endivia]|nr:hypothetical protein L1887_31545 [Cichorium endivia]
MPETPSLLPFSTGDLFTTTNILQNVSVQSPPASTPPSAVPCIRWDSAFSSPRSSSSLPSSSTDDNIDNRTNGGRMSDIVSSFSSRPPVGSHHRRVVASPRSSHLLTDADIVQTPSHSISRPQTLLNPELPGLFKRNFRRESAANKTSKYVLPLPEDATKKSVENRGISYANHSNSKTPPRKAIDRSRDSEHKESQFLQNWPQVTATLNDEHKHRKTVSAPTTPISSRAVFPSPSKTNTPLIQLWSTPELPSPVHSTQIRTATKSPNPSSSPLHKKSSIESPMSRHGSNVQAPMASASVHPLPLPPGAPLHPPSSPSQTNNKPHSLPKTPRKSRWQKGKLIGRGTFGSVYVSSNRETGALCAMKEVEILPDDPKSAECIKQLEQEIDVLSQLKHPNIVQYFGSEIVGDRFYIYLEYVHPGSISKYARDHYGGMTESIVRNFTRHIVSGLAYLHSTKTIHRDIKGANLLVDANGVVKLADFGMAKHLSGEVTLSLKGSPYWMAPEVLRSDIQKDCSHDLALAVDIWSLGCTIIEMMNGKPPWSEYEGPAAMFKVMKETPPIPETMSLEGKNFLRCCFVRNPAERPTASMLLEHKFLNNSIKTH